MKKEIIWNLGILLFAILLVFTFTMNTGGIGSWEASSPTSFLNTGSKIKLGMVLGIMLIIFRYVNLAILSIPNKNVKVLVLMASYSLPIAIAFIILKDDNLDSFEPSMFSVEEIEREVVAMRKAGMFKSYAEKSDEFVTKLVLDRARHRHGGWGASSSLWNARTNSINKYELLRLDSEKTWYEDDSEFIVQGNNDYARMLSEFTHLSEGNFQAKNIKETWESAEVVKLSFKSEGKEHTIYPEFARDWADVDGVLKYINTQILDDVDYAFYGGRIEDVFVIGLSGEELEGLSGIRGLEFREIEQEL